MEYIAHECSREPQMGKCKWDWCEKYKGFLCSICGKEVLRMEQLNIED